MKATGSLLHAQSAGHVRNTAKDWGLVQSARALGLIKKRKVYSNDSSCRQIFVMQSCLRKKKKKRKKDGCSIIPSLPGSFVKNSRSIIPWHVVVIISGSPIPTHCHFGSPNVILRVAMASAQ